MSEQSSKVVCIVRLMTSWKSVVHRSKCDYRICKGIYLEPEEIAYTTRTDIRNKTNDAIRMALEHGAYVGIASHDVPVVDYSLEVLKEFNMGHQLTIQEPTQEPQEKEKDRVTNSKCCLAYVARCDENSPSKDIVLASTSHTEKSGMSTAYDGCKKTQPSGCRLPRHFDALDKPSVITFGLFLLALVRRFDPLLICSFGKIGFGLKPRRPLSMLDVVLLASSVRIVLVLVVHANTFS